MSKIQKVETKKINLYEELASIECEITDLTRHELSVAITEFGKQKRMDLIEDIHALIVSHPKKIPVKMPYKGEKTILGIKYDLNCFPEDLIKILHNYVQAISGNVELVNMKLT